MSLAARSSLSQLETAQLTRARTEQHRTGVKRSWSCYAEEEVLPTTSALAFMHTHNYKLDKAYIVNGPLIQHTL